MSQYKLLLIDLDGTTVASKGEALPSQRVIDAVKAAKGKVQISVATGRPFDLAQPVIKALGLRGYGVLNGGAQIIDMETGEIKVNQTLDVETQLELIRVIKPFGHPIYGDEDQYGASLDAANELKPAAKLFVEAVTTKESIAMLEQLNGVPNASAHPTTSWQDGDVVDIHITHVGATKRHGAEQLTDMLGLTKEQVIAIGDGHNDVPLLEAAGLKVAMGNAPDEVKALADYIAPSLDDDGVADVIETFILNA